MKSMISMMVLVLIAYAGSAAPPCAQAQTLGPVTMDRPSPFSAQPKIPLDDCGDATLWSAHPADGVQLEISNDQGILGQCLRLDFEFTGGGYAIARRELDLPLPENYIITFALRGEAPANHLEFKLIDASGENVWWSVMRDVPFPAEWQQVSIKKRHISFAWGPQGGGEIERAAALEFAITAGSGGKGTIWIDQIRLTDLPPSDATPKKPTNKASSAERDHGVYYADDGDPEKYWAAESSDTEPWFELDFPIHTEIGGLVVDWAPGRHATDYIIEGGDSSESWRTLHTVTGNEGGRDYIYLPETEHRFIHIRILNWEGESPAIAEIHAQPLEWSASREAFFMNIAADAPRGHYPRGITGEQSYWTVVGADGDKRECLINEDGMIETGPGRFSIEPFLESAGELATWADVQSECSLANGYLPIPSVLWRWQDLQLTITAYAIGEPGASSVIARYRLKNLGERPRPATLHLALRPFQVNPPSQTLNIQGGTARICEIAAGDRHVKVNGELALVQLTAPKQFGALGFHSGDLVSDHLSGERKSEFTRVNDPLEAATGLLAYSYDLLAGKEEIIDLLIPLYPDSCGPPDEDGAPTAWATLQYEQSREAWQAKADRVTIQLPESASRVVETMKAQLGYILVNRAGPAIQPGARSYARSWIRDGALTSSALLRLGHPEPVREFLEWYAPNQYVNGKIPCVVDARGADPVPEHDSSGEFIFLVAEYYRYMRDRDLAQQMWPRVVAAADYLEGLRQQRRTDAYRTPENKHFFGLLPPSISHEGYSAKPMHSYWDDFFALRGFKDAVFLAQELGHTQEQDRLATILDELSADLAASVTAAMQHHGIDYIPGCADLGDFDATSTTIAFSPTGAAGILARADLEQTFQRYWDFFRDRRDREPWDAYTPYELRNVGAFVRLGWRERAHQLLDWFFLYQRPPGWRHWAEVISSHARVPRFLGDMPHTWVGSDYVRSVLDMLAYVDEERDALVVAAGVPSAWLEPEPGVVVRDLPTPYGAISFTMVRKDTSIEARLEGDLRIPAGGVLLRPPLRDSLRRAAVNGLMTSPSDDGEILVRDLPARVRLEFAY